MSLVLFFVWFVSLFVNWCWVLLEENGYEL